MDKRQQYTVLIPKSYHPGSLWLQICAHRELFDRYGIIHDHIGYGSGMSVKWDIQCTENQLLVLILTTNATRIESDDI